VTVAVEDALADTDPTGEDESVWRDWEDAATTYANHRLRRAMLDRKDEVMAALAGGK
jgi:hypothetical protein